MVARQRHLRGADQVQVVGLQAVDLVGVCAEESGARHHFRAHQHRRDHQREPVPHGHLGGQLQQAQLQQRAGTGEEVEARTRHLGAAFHVDQPERLAQLEVVLGVLDRRRLADGVEHHEVVLAAGRHAVDDHVADRHVRGGEGALGLGLRGLGGLDLLGQVLRSLQQGRTLLGRRLAHQLAGGLLIGAQVVGRRDGGSPGGIGLQQLVDARRVLSASPLRRTDGVGIVAQQLEVDHGRNPTF